MAAYIENIEQVNVIDIYDQIPGHFDKTRYNIWPSVFEFIDALLKGSMILDAGCGNGKNMTIRDDCTFIGSDLSIEMVKISQSKGLNVIHADIKQLPFKDDTFDAVMSIAVIHHLSTIEQRVEAVLSLIRVTKTGGYIMIQVWNNIENKNKKKFKLIKDNDYLVTWSNMNTGKTYDRYYHLFNENELLELIVDLPVDIIRSFDEANNSVIIIQKRK